LVVDTVAYEDQGSLRSVLYRGSLSEMVVPYGDPNPGWFFRNAFDVGENNMGLYADSLEPLTDAPSNATFINAVLADDKGVPYEIPRAIALYERDGGLLWKHYDDKLKPSRAEPVCQINDHAREKARFSNSEKEAGNIELPGGVHKASQSRDYSPGNHDSCNPLSCAPAFDDEGSGYFEQEFP
jgi:hypothetical protein